MAEVIENNDSSKIPVKRINNLQDIIDDLNTKIQELNTKIEDAGSNITITYYE